MLLKLKCLERERVVGKGILDTEVNCVGNDLFPANLTLIKFLPELTSFLVISELEGIQSWVTARIFLLQPALFGISEPLVNEAVELESS